MTNMQAAVGFSQLEIINKILKIRNNQMLLYQKYLSQIKEIKIRTFKKWCSPVHWMTTITINKKYLRNKLIHFLLKEGIDARPMINPVHHAKHFKNIFKKQKFSNSEYISANSVHLPSSTNLKKKQIKFICKKIDDFFNQIKK
jgi:perosamine synthetase